MSYLSTRRWQPNSGGPRAPSLVDQHPHRDLYLMTGALAGRLLGMLVDGAVSKQWLLVAVEAIVMALAAFWLWRCGETAP